MHPRRPLLVTNAALLGLLLACSGSGDDGDDGTNPTIDPLEFATDALPMGAIGQAYDQKIGVRGGEPPYTFSISAGELPTGLMLKSDTGQISGMAGAPGPFSFTVKVEDSGGRDATKDYDVYITPDTLAVVNADLPNGDDETFYDTMLEATGGIPPYTWALVDGAFPGGVALGAAGRISGTPTSNGVFEVTVEVTDSEGARAMRAFAFTIRPANPLISVDPTLPYARDSEPYDYQLVVIGGREPYTWALTDGALPNALQLTADGRIAGVPMEAGEFRFTVQVTDADQKTDEVQLILIGLGPLAITTTSLPLAILNEQYSAQLTASGGLEPYRWFVAPNTPLPMGMTLSEDGELSGAPTEEGDFMLRIRLQDDTGVLAPSARLFLRVRDLRIYTANPSVTFPPLCTTSTHVSYQNVDLQVNDSFSIADINVTLDIAYMDTANAHSNEKLRVVLFSPDGRQAPICGNSTGVRGGNGCPGTDGIQATYGPLGVLPQRPLDTFHGTNPMGTWRLRVAVVRPSTGAGGACDQAGMINSITLTMTPDTTPDPYVVVTGHRPNNLLLEPWVRISGGGIVAQQELFMAATLWDVGPNGRREAGGGDDVPDPRSFTWSGTGLPTGTAISADGHVTTGAITGRGLTPMITATDGGSWVVSMPLHVVPPDWSHDVREF